MAGQEQDKPGEGKSVVRWPAAWQHFRLAGGIWLVSTPALAAEAGPPTVLLAPETALLAVVVGACALALACGLLALVEFRNARRFKQALRLSETRARGRQSLRDALLSAGRESVLVWGAELGEPLAYGDANLLLDQALAGPDATDLSAALDALSERGTLFSMVVRSPDDRQITIRGRPAGGHAILFLEPVTKPAGSDADLHDVLDALPVPVWVRGKDLSLRFVNRAFLAATGAASLESALESGIALDRSERDLAGAARGEGKTVEAKRYAMVGGRRRALAFTLTPLDKDGVAGTAIDVTPAAEAEARLRQHVDAHSETLDRLATAVAIFGHDRKLLYCNGAYRRLWGLPDAWLDTGPTEGEILDRLREHRRLPEQRDFRAWKQEHLTLFERTDDFGEEQWHLPGGKTLRVTARPHPLGGLIFLYEDVSDRLRLESSFNILTKVQSATLDALKEGVAVFGPDGRLRLHNAAFTEIWKCAPTELDGAPHLKAVADACAARFGRDEIWDIVTNAVTTATPERHGESKEAERSDGKVLSLTLAPLPDGAMLVSFADVTDHFNIEAALRERNQALEKTDQLKTEFVKRVSYELRTPLNSILGFSELLKAGSVGPLSVRQDEYVGAVLSASLSLRDLVEDILDLSQIEAGAMTLDLEQVDLHALLSLIVENASAGAAKIGLKLKLDSRLEEGRFVADKRRISQVVLNLLSNALKYTPSGGLITVGGSIVGDDVQIFVADTGPGLPPELLPSAFERFSAKSGGGARAGAGLGLALVKHFVELHHGWVELQSEETRGTKVTCHLPRNAIPARTASPPGAAHG